MVVQNQEHIGWGLAGLGRHGHRFIAPAISHSKNGQLMAVFSRNMERAKNFAERHNCPSTYDSLEAMLRNERVEAVYICSPNYVHKEQVLQAAHFGKHVLCEKPLATSKKDVLEMLEACRQADVKLGVGFHLRHNPVHIKAKEMVSAGVIGEPVYAEIQYMHATAGAEGVRQRPTWRTDPETMGGGRLVSVGEHAIDLIQFVLQKTISQVVAMVDAGWYVTGSDNLIQVSMLLEGHIVASLSAGAIRHPFNHLVLYGKSATLRCRDSISYYGGGHIDIISDRGTRTIDFGKYDVYTLEVEAFANSILTGAEPNASGLDGLRAVEVTTGIYESLRKKSVVKIRAQKSHSFSNSR